MTWRDVPVVILAGGAGTRLRDAHPDLPKCLAPVAGEPFLFRQLAWVASQRYRRVTLALGYRAQQVVDAVGDGSRWDLQVTHAIEAEPRGTAGALKLLESDLAGPFFVLNGDTLAEVSLDAMMEAHIGAAAAATVGLARRPTAIDCGAVTLDNQGWVQSFLEKPEAARGETDATAEWVNAGVYVLMPRVLEHVPVGESASIERTLLPELLGHGIGILGYAGVDRFWDIGTPERLAALEKRLAEGA